MKETPLRSRCIGVLFYALTLLAVAHTATADTLTISWDPSTDQDAVGYYLYVGTSAGYYSYRFDVGNATTFAFSTAVAGTRYYFTASSYDAQKVEGYPAAEVSGYSNIPPLLANPGTQSTAVGTWVSLQLSGSDPDGMPVSYAATGLPVGLSLGQGTGLIAGTPTSAGTYTVTAVVTDGALSISQTFTWSVGTTTPPTLASSGKDLVGNFGPGIGIWALRQTGWQSVHAWNPRAIVSGDFDGNGLDDLAIDFSPNAGLWLWMNHANWVPLHNLNPTQMVVGDLDNNGRDDLILSFPGYGIWEWKNNTTWQLLHSAEALHLAIADIDGSGTDDLIIDFANYGLWSLNNHATWKQLHSSNVTALTTVDLDGNGTADIVASFAGKGLWVYRNNTQWTFLHSSTANVLAAGQLDTGRQADVVVDFGEGRGVWIYRDSATWTQLHYLRSQGLVVADFDGDGRDEIMIGFAGAGLWKNSNNVWTSLSNSTPAALVASRLH